MTISYCTNNRYSILLARYKLLLGILTCSASNLFCQDINLRFQHITTEQGLSQNTVDCILQDSRGFMWFGTWNGLNRYDGYSFTIYKSENHPQSLSNNFIYSICEDREGNIWVATKNGVNKLIYSENRFIRFLHDPDLKNSISSNRINVVFCDKEGSIWVGTADSGLDYIKSSQHNDNFTITHYKSVPGQPNGLPGNEINAIIEDSRGNIWVGTNEGLVKFDKQTRQFMVYRNNPFNTNSITYNVVYAIYEDRQGYLWIGTMYGLNKLNPKTGIFTRFVYNTDDPGSLSHYTVNAIMEDMHGSLLIGTLGGLNLFQPKSNKFYRYPVNQNDDYSLNNEFINSICSDNQGNVWIGTDKGGINKYNIFQKEFGYIVQKAFDNNSLSNNTINSVLEESSTLWIGTAGGGLNKFDGKTNKFKHFRNNPHNPVSINSNFITSLCRDPHQNMWIGTWGGGLDKLISVDDAGYFQHFIPDAGNTSICNVFVSSLWPDEKGFILVGTLGGLDLFYPDKKTFRHIANNPKWKNKISEVGCILKDQKGYYWIGTRLGLYRVSASKLENRSNDSDFTCYLHLPNDTNSIPGNYIISLCNDRMGDIWIGTYGNGISRLHLTSNQKAVFTNYDQKEGLCNNVVYSILEDEQGILWLSTDHGLSRFDPEQKSFKNFYVTDGLQSNQFYWSAAYRCKDGKMYFGGMKGLNFFYPNKIRDNSFVPKAVITDFEIYNNTVNIGLWNNKKVILRKIITETSEINLSYKENVFSFEFSALDFFLPEKTQYQYKMEGVDQDWVTVPASRRFVTYTNLKGGAYTFWVRASNSDGVWSNTPTKLKINISPPFWATLWFKVTIVILIAFFITLYLKFRTKRLEAQKRILEMLVRERTVKIEEQKKELETQAGHLKESYTQLEQRQEQIEGQKAQLEQQNLEISDQRDRLIELNKRVQLVNQLKLRFFTNISHEFRTPLTLILGPLSCLLGNHKVGADVKDTLTLINRNAQRLLHLINQLMEFRKIETGKIDLKVSKGNIIRFLENIFHSFDDLAKQRNINYIFDSLNVPDEAWFDQEKLENITYNLLSNAFKFTKEGGQITLAINTGLKDEPSDKIKSFLEIKVMDTGIGISKEYIHDIFKRFYRVNSPENTKVLGSGIGLSLTKELVKAYQGHIFVESRTGLGSTFTIQIPYQKDSFKEKEIITDQLLYVPNLQAQVDILGQEMSPEQKLTGKIEVSDKNSAPLVLIVEDNFDLRSFITLSVHQEFRTLEAANGKDGYELAIKHSPDLIISDIMMPEMDGLELCSRLKNDIQTSHIPVILLTARASIENWIEGLETGADDYIPKPFNLKVLKAKTKNLIENRNRLKKTFLKDLAPEPAALTSSSVDQQFLKKAIDIVDEHYKNPEFGVEEFVSKMYISRSLLYKKLIALTDQSPNDFITSIRLKKSIQLLYNPDINISEVAYQVGFNDPKYFSRCFKKHFGKSPSEYIKDQTEHSNKT